MVAKCKPFFKSPTSWLNLLLQKLTHHLTVIKASENITVRKFRANFLKKKNNSSKGPPKRNDSGFERVYGLPLLLPDSSCHQLSSKQKIADLSQWVWNWVLFLLCCMCPHVLCSCAGIQANPRMVNTPKQSTAVLKCQNNSKNKRKHYINITSNFCCYKTADQSSKTILHLKILDALLSQMDNKFTNSQRSSQLAGVHLVNG